MSNWIDGVWRSEDKEGMICPFVEWDTYGKEKKCLLNPSKDVCQLCLLGQICEHIEDLKDKLTHK